MTFFLFVVFALIYTVYAQVIVDHNEENELTINGVLGGEKVIRNGQVISMTRKSGKKKKKWKNWYYLGVNKKGRYKFESEATFRDYVLSALALEKGIEKGDFFSIQRDGKDVVRAKPGILSAEIGPGHALIIKGEKGGKIIAIKKGERGDTKNIISMLGETERKWFNYVYVGDDSKGNFEFWDVTGVYKVLLAKFSAKRLNKKLRKGEFSVKPDGASVVRPFLSGLAGSAASAKYSNIYDDDMYGEYYQYEGYKDEYNDYGYNDKSITRSKEYEKAPQEVSDKIIKMDGFASKQEYDELLAQFEYDAEIEEARQKKAMTHLAKEKYDILRAKNRKNKY